MRWKWILGIAAALIVGVGVAVVAILLSYDYNKFKPQITSACLKATGRELTLGGDINLKIGFTPTLALENISFQNTPWGSQPEMIKIRRFEIQVALLPLIGGNVEVKRFIIVEPQILVETDKSGRSNLEFKTPEKHKTSEPQKKEPVEGKMKLPELTFKDVRIEKGRLTYKNGQTGDTHAATISSLTIGNTGPHSPINLGLKGAYNNKIFEIAGFLGSLPALTDPNKICPFKLTARVVDCVLTVDGTVKDLLSRHDFKINFRFEGKDLANLGQLSGKTLPIRGPFEASGTISNPAPKKYNISDLKVALGANGLSGSVKISLAADLPEFVADFSSKKLDLCPFLSKNTKKTGEKAASKTPKREKLFPEKIIEIEALKQVNADVKLRIGKLVLPQLALDDLSVNAFLSNGHLKIKPLQAALGGGTLNGGLTLRPKSKGVALSTALKIDQFNLGLMLKELEITDVLDGIINVDLNLYSGGESVAAVMGKLNGKISVLMDNGRIRNKYVNLLDSDISSSIFRLINPSEEKEEKTDFTDINCFVSRFDIKNGLADITVLVLNTDSMSVVGDGTVNLKTEKLDLSLKPIPNKSIGGVGLSMSELTKPFKLGGTLAAPSLVIDYTQAAITIGKSIGGMALFGPAGIAAALVGGTSDDENPCLKAIETAQQGGKTPKDKTTEEEKSIVNKTTEGIKESIKGLEETLNNLFGK